MLCDNNNEYIAYRNLVGYMKGKNSTDYVT